MGAIVDAHATLDGTTVTSAPLELGLHPYATFTTFVATGGRTVGWSDHVARLKEGVAVLWGEDLSEDRLTSFVGSHLRGRHGARRVRVTVFPRVLDIARPASAEGQRVLVTSVPQPAPLDVEPDFSVMSTPFVREVAQVKSTALVGQLWLRRTAQVAGYDDALFHARGRVLEGPTWSLLAWRGGEVVTPSGPSLPGVTARHVGRIAADLGWSARTRTVRLPELFDADLVLATNAGHPVRAVTRVDGVVIAADRGLLREVADAYRALPGERFMPVGPDA